MSCRAVHRSEINAALKLILSNGGRAAGDTQVVDFLHYAIEREIDLTAMWVAVRGERIVWAALPVLNPGRTMLLLIPDAAPADDTPAMVMLLDCLCTHFAARDITLTQALLDPDATVAGALVERCRFTRLAELVYLQGDVRRAPPPPATLRLSTYGPDTHAQFARAVLSSYEDSLDCPALNGVRAIDDILAGHKGTGAFSSDLWLMAVDDDRQPLAVLLLAPIAGATMELVYLGVCAPARGRGLGKAMLRHAMSLTRAHGLQRLTLAVDAANAPAMRLYLGHGMYRACSKIALMRDLRKGPALGAALEPQPNAPGAMPR